MQAHRISRTMFVRSVDATDNVSSVNAVNAVCDNCGSAQPNAMAHDEMRAGWEYRPSEWMKRFVGCMRCNHPYGRYA